MADPEDTASEYAQDIAEEGMGEETIIIDFWPE